MPYPYRLTEPAGPTLGLVVLQADEVIEGDLRRLLPPGATLHVTRVPSAPEVTTGSLATMEAALPAAAALLPPAVGFDAVGYGCTSGTAVIGVERVASLVGGACRTAAVTEPVSALLAATSRLGIRRVAFLSPYVAEVSELLRGLLAAAGLDTPVFGSFDEAEEARVARIDPISIREAAIDIATSAEVDAVFLSCTNLRALDVLTEIERETGKPALSSNQVLAWHLCLLAGAGGRALPYGRLFAA